MKKLLLTAFAASMGLMAAQAAPVTISADITTSQTWTADNVYILNKTVFVKNEATLTIEAGTVIRGSATTIGDDTTALFVTRGSKLMALGTKEKPIIMTAAMDTNVPGFTSNPIWSTITPSATQEKAGLWGGLVMCGSAYITVDGSGNVVGPLVETTATAEGLADPGDGSTEYGGSDDDDSSGVLNFVSVRYAGYGYADASEINGITLCGVGRGTTIDYVEVANNIDDGIEFFGGTVNTKHVAILNVGDDSFDVDQGYRGRCQFLYIQQGFCTTTGTGVSDHGFEMDGVENTDGNMPWALQRFENITLVGHGFNDGGSGNIGIEMDDNCRPQIFNAIVMDVNNAVAVIEADSASPNSYEGMSVMAKDFSVFTHVPGTGAEADEEYYYKSQRTGYTQTALEHFVTYNVLDDNMYTGNKNTPDTAIDLTGKDWNVASTLPIRYIQRGDPSASSENGNILGNVDVIDPRPVARWANSPYTAEDDGFSVPVNYYGAFAPEGPTWLDGWTTMAMCNMLTNAPVASSGSIVLDEAGFSVGFEATIGTTYTLEESTDSGSTWTAVAGATSVVADKVNMTLSDFGTEGVASKLYKVVAQ